MTANIAGKFDTKLPAHLNESLTSYLNKIELKKIDDIDLVAQSLAQNFGQNEWLSAEGFSAKIKILNHIEEISPQTQQSFNQRLELTEEIYLKSNSFIEPLQATRNDETETVKIKALQRFIIDKICKIAEQLLNLSFDEKNRYVSHFTSLEEKKITEHDGQNSEIEDLGPNLSQMGNTLSDSYALLTCAIKVEVEKAGLSYMRNCDIELHDDIPLLKVLFQSNSNLLLRYIDLLKLNRGFVIDFITYNPHLLSDIEGQLPYAQDAAMAAINKDANALRALSSRWVANEQLALTAIRKDPKLFTLVKPYFENDHQVAVEAVALWDDNMEIIDPTYLNTKFLVEVVGMKIFNLLVQCKSMSNFGLDELKEIFFADNTYIVARLKKQPDGDEILPKAFLNGLQKFFNKFDGLRYKHFALQAVRKRGELLKSMGAELRDDQDVVLTALESSGNSDLYFEAGPNCQVAPMIALEAVLLNCDIFNHLDKDLKENRKIAQFALNMAMTRTLFKYAGEFQDSQKILSMVSNEALSGLDIDRNRADFVEMLQSGYWSCICNFFSTVDSANFRNLALAIVGRDGSWLCAVGNVFRDDPEIVLTAIKSKNDAFYQAGPKCKSDPKIALQAIKLCASNLQFVGPALRKDRKLVASAVTQDFSLLRFADLTLRNNLTFLPFLRLKNYIKVTFDSFKNYLKSLFNNFK